MSDYETKRDAAAGLYSKASFSNAQNFTVMKDVCNDEIYSDAFIAGADWAYAEKRSFMHLQTVKELAEVTAKLEIAYAKLSDCKCIRGDGI